MVVLQLLQRHLAHNQTSAVGQCVRTRDHAAHAGQVARDATDGVCRNRELGIDDRLHDDRPGFRDGIEEGFLARLDEGDFLGVDRVMLAVVDDDLDVLHRVAVDGALCHGLLRARLDGRNETARDGAANDFAGELEAVALWQRLDAQVDLAELARAAGLFLVAVVALGLGRDRLAVGD